MSHDAESNGVRLVTVDVIKAPSPGQHLHKGDQTSSPTLMLRNHSDDTQQPPTCGFALRISTSKESPDMRKSADEFSHQ